MSAAAMIARAMTANATVASAVRKQQPILACVFLKQERHSGHMCRYYFTLLKMAHDLSARS